MSNSRAHWTAIPGTIIAEQYRVAVDLQDLEISPAADPVLPGCEG